jgi:hypothetical protein
MIHLGSRHLSEVVTWLNESGFRARKRAKSLRIRKLIFRNYSLNIL